MGAPRGNRNAAGPHKKGMRRAYNSLSRMDKIEIRANRKAGNLSNLKKALRTSRPNFSAWKSRKRRMLNYLKYI